MSVSSHSSDERYDDPSSSAANNKRTKTHQPPLSFVTFNVNGLISRCQKDEQELDRLLLETGHPDVICLQEVRLKASSPHKRGTPLPKDYELVKNTMESNVFRRYDKYYSLADTRYAGTCTLIHKRVGFEASSSQQQGNDNTTTTNVAFSIQSALTLLLTKYQLTRQDVGIIERNKGEGDSPSRTTTTKVVPVKKQTSMKSFFVTKPSKKTPSRNSNSSTSSEHQHHPEGRFQFFSFPNFDLIQTYVPNNGTKAESFLRRQEWDRDMKEFLLHRRQVLDKAAAAAAAVNSSNTQQQRIRDRTLLWCGDMNVAQDYRDGTNWEKKQQQTSGAAAAKAGGDSSCSDDDDDDNSNTNQYYEWWTDESKCFAGGQAKKLDRSRSQDDRGMPSFTINERRRFAELLKEADFCDIWRTLHPNGDSDDNNGDSEDATNKSYPKYKTQWDRPNWTWRGHLSKDSNAYGSKYEGKGQRLDYFLLSPSSLITTTANTDGSADLNIVDQCKILGYGARREGLFCGSDHCVSLLKLKQAF